MSYKIIKSKHCGSSNCKIAVGKDPLGVCIIDLDGIQEYMEWYNKNIKCGCRVEIFKESKL